MTAVEVYAPRTIKVRATRDAMELRRTSLIEIAREGQPASVRNIYYRAVVAGLVEKSQNGYRKIQRQVLDLRRTGEIPWSWIVDTGRSAHWPQVYASAAEMLGGSISRYHRDPWHGVYAPRVEVWCESRSIAGALMDLKDRYAIPIFPLGGQSSDTFAYEAAQEYYNPGRRVVILYAGDYDPAGLQIDAQIEGKLREHSGRSDIDFRRLTVTAEQAARIQALGTKPKSSTWVDYSGVRHDFIGQAIEAEAIPTPDLRRVFTEAIESIAMEHYGYDVFAEAKEITDTERDRLRDLIAGWEG